MEFGFDQNGRRDPDASTEALPGDSEREPTTERVADHDGRCLVGAGQDEFGELFNQGIKAFRPTDCPEGSLALL